MRLVVVARPDSDLKYCMAARPSGKRRVGRTIIIPPILRQQSLGPSDKLVIMGLPMLLGQEKEKKWKHHVQGRTEKKERDRLIPGKLRSREKNDLFLYFECR